MVEEVLQGMRLMNYISELTEMPPIKATVSPVPMGAPEQGQPDPNVLRQKILPLLRKNCSQYINEVKGMKYCLGRYTRGAKESVKTYVEITPRKDRRPSDTPQWLHDYLDKEFKKKFGWSPRSSGVFCLPIPKESAYPTYKLVFPFDGYKYLWNPNVDDLFVQLRDFVYSMDGAMDVHYLAPGFHGTTGIGEALKEKIDELVFGYRATDLGDAIRINEIMLSCKKYYLVNLMYANDLFEEGLLF